MSSPSRPQSIKSNHLRKACAYCSADQVSAPSIRVTCFENLHIINIIALNPCLVSGSAGIKSNVSVKKGTGGDFINCKDL